MRSAERSLLSHLDAPVLVADPQGRTVYVNPAFERQFEVESDQVRGAHLAQLFEGGGRESVLHAAATACGAGSSVRFRMRERGMGFSAVASPIFSEHESVGVVILLKEEVEEVERLFHLHRKLSEAIDDYGKLLAEEADPSWERSGLEPEERKHAFERIRQWSAALRRELHGRLDAA